MSISTALIVTILIGISLSIADEHVSYEGYNVWSVYPKSEVQIKKLRRWEDIYGIDFWELSRPGKESRIMVGPLNEKPFLDFLVDSNIEHKILIENVERKFEEERRQQKIATDRLARMPQVEGKYTVDFDHFWTTREINDYINYLLSFYRDIVTSDIVGHTIQGQLMRSIKISLHGEVDGSRPIIFIDAGIHAREWISYMVAMKITHELVEHSHHYADLMENVDFVILPNVNPDGYDYTHSTNRMWRKNRRVNSNAACPGVDGNRNYAYMWQPVSNQCSEAYAGIEPFSEPENRAVQSIIDRFGTAIKLYISFHSYGEYVLYPWGFDFIYIDNWEQHQEAGDRFMIALQSYNGTTYDVGNGAFLLYPAYGCSDDYMASRGVQLSYTIELSGGQGNGFDLPAAEIPRVTNEVWLGFQEYIDYVGTYNWE